MLEYPHGHRDINELKWLKVMPNLLTLYYMTKLYLYCKYSLFRIIFLLSFLELGLNVYASTPYTSYTTKLSRFTRFNFNDTTKRYDIQKADLSIHRKKSFIRAASETFGMNMSLWAFDRYVLKGHYAYISWKSIKENFKHGFEWDNDHLNTNMFAHPYNGSLFFNAGRSNGFNFWQSELFAIGGSAMWEMFMECERPSTNDIIATPIGGAALGEVFYRTSDRILDDRTTGGERLGRELASFLISPMKGVTRLITGQAWKKSRSSGREYDHLPFNIDVSLGARMLTYHDDDAKFKVGTSARLNIEYGDPFDADSKIPYDYFTCMAEFNIMETQPLLSRVEIIGRLLSKELIDSKHCDLSVGLFQHFDFFDSDTISDRIPNVIEPCVVPYKLGTPASVGVGSIFRYQKNRSTLAAYAHFNGVLLGGILSDNYRYYNRNYNWATGFSVKFGLKGNFWDDRLSVALKNHYYRFYTREADSTIDVDWTDTPDGKPVNIAGDNSIGSFYHMEGQVDYRLWKQLFVTTRFDFYSRSTKYREMIYVDNWGASDWYIDSKQMSLQLMLTCKF